MRGCIFLFIRPSGLEFVSSKLTEKAGEPVSDKMVIWGYLEALSVRYLIFPEVVEEGQEANKSILLPSRPKDEAFASSHQLLPGSNPVSCESASCVAAFYEGSSIHGTGSIPQQLRDLPVQ